MSTLLFQVATVDEARDRLWSYLTNASSGVEQVPLQEALGRVLAQDALSDVAVPAFSRSTVDGFAVKAADTFGASETLPALITITGEVLMGNTAEQALNPGETVRIATGGMLPPGADAVVMVEYTEELDSETVTVLRPVAPGENVVQAGEDVQKGELVLTAGWQLRPQDLGVLAGIGITRVPVSRKPLVGIISTGDELVDPEQEPQPGQIRDINTYALAGLVHDCGGQAKSYGIVKDTFEGLLAVVSQALEENDVVIISGGSSVGTRDATSRVLAALGDPGVLVHGVSVRPGKPSILGVVGDKPVFGLPGHPVSAMVIFDIFIRPVLWHLQGLKRGNPEPVVEARVSRNLASGPGREDHIRVMLEDRDGELWAVPVLGKSGLITTMVRADGIIRIPLDKEGLMTGDKTLVRLF